MKTVNGFFADEYNTVYKYNEEQDANICYGKLINETLEEWVSDYYMSEYHETQRHNQG